MYQELINARRTDLHTAQHTINQRMEWAELNRMDRLERALKTVKSRLQMLPNLKPEAN